MTVHTKRPFKHRLLSMLLTAAMLLGMTAAALPTVQVSATIIENSGSGSALLNIDSTPPAAYATAVNPYGYDADVAFTLSVGNELLYLGGANGKKQTSILNGGSISDIQSYVKSPNTASGSYMLPDGVWNWVTAVAFDNSKDNARDDHVLFVGVKKDDQHAYAWVLDCASNTIVGPTDLGNMDWIGSDYEQYMSTSLFDVAAGDFDGDGVDTLLVYVPLNLNSNEKTGCTLYELSYNGSSLTKGSSCNQLLMDRYITDQNNATYTDDSNSVAAARNKLAVSMQVGDFNGDRIEDLGVLSYSHYRYNPPSDTVYYIPQLKVCYGADGRSTLSNVTGTTYEVANSADSTFPVAASLAAGDFNGDGYDDLYAVGVSATRSYSAPGYYPYPDASTYYPDPDGSTWYLQCFYGGNSMTVGKKAATESNKWFCDGFYESDYCYGRVMAAGVAISGTAAADMLFISGSLYQVSTGTPVHKLTNSYFGSADNGAGANIIANTFMQSVAVGNFDNNAAGREQVVFTVGLKQSGADDYHYMAGMLCGTDFADSTYSDGSTCYGVAASYYCSDLDEESDYIHENKGDDPDEGLNCLLIAADIDTDGVVAKYRGAGYVYTDPDVRAVLQAAPYFGDITSYGKNSTGYTIETSYSEADSDTDAGSGSIGFAASGKVPFTFSASVGLGLKGGVSRTFTDTYSTNHKETFAASSEDVVVVNRIPLLVYKFDVQDANGKFTGETQLEMTVPQEPVYETLTIDDYNAFVAEYNAMMESAGVEDEPLVAIDAAANWMDGNEGNPYAYNQLGWNDSTIYATQISKSSFDLGKSNASATVNWTESNSHSKSITGTFGFYLKFSVLFGPAGAVGGAGVEVNGDYTHSWGSATTNGSAEGSSCTVQDLNGTALLEDGMPKAVLDMYSFTWTFGQWERHLSGDANHMTPFVGYALTNISSPTPPVNDLKATAAAADSIKLTWSKPEVPAGAPAVTGYYVYRVEEDASYTKISKQLAASATSYTVEGLEPLTAYTFVVTTTGVVNAVTAEGTWSNKASATTRLNSHKVTFEAQDPSAAVISAYTTGYKAIQSGDSVTSHSIVSLTATAADDNSRILGIELDRGEDVAVQFIEPNDDQTCAECTFVVTSDTAVTVLTERFAEGSDVTFKAAYEEDGASLGTVSAAVGDVPLTAPGGWVSEAVTFTAIPTDGYALTGWRLTTDGVAKTVGAANMNPFTLELKADNYYVEAIFELEAEAKAIITVEQPAEGGYIRLTDASGNEIELNDADSAEVALGTDVTFTAVCSAGYVLDSWSGDAAEQTASSFTVTANTHMTVGAKLKAPVKYRLNYTVTSGNQTGGVAVDPAVSSGGYVAAGTELTVSVKAADGYRIDSMTITNGTDVRTVDMNDELYTEAQKTFVITANASLEVGFVPIETYTVSIKLDTSHGTLSVMVNNKAVGVSESSFEYTCRYKDDVTVTVTPDIGYHLAVQTTLPWQYIGDDRYQVSYVDLTQDIADTIHFTNGDSSLVPESEDGFAIVDVVCTPDYFSGERICYGGDLSFRVVPTDARGIAEVTLFDPYDSIREEVITDNGDGTWSVHFPDLEQSPWLEVRLNTGYHVSTSVSGNGSLTVKRNGRVLSEQDWIVTGDVLDIVAVPDEGYELVSLTANGTPITDGTYTVQTSNVTAAAVFERIVYEIPVSGDGYTVCNVVCDPAQDAPDGYVEQGASLSYTVIPDEGQDIPSVLINAGALQQQADGSWLVRVEDIQSPLQMTVTLTEHTHRWTYSVDDDTDTITAACEKSHGCPVDAGTVMLQAPTDMVFNGSVKQAVVSGLIDGVTPTVTHCCENGCRGLGEHTVTLTAETASVSLTFRVDWHDAGLYEALRLFYYVNGLVDLTPDELAMADVNGDGTVDLQDALRLFYYVNGQL